MQYYDNTNIIKVKYTCVDEERAKEKNLYRKKDIFSMNDFSHRHFANIRITLQRHKMIKKKMKTEYCLRNKQIKSRKTENVDSILIQSISFSYKYIPEI